MEKHFNRSSTRICFRAVIIPDKYNDLPDGINLLCKIFAGDTSLFSKAMARKHFEIKLNKDLKLIRHWLYQWKILFNPDPTKKAKEVCLSHNRENVSPPPLTFNNNRIQSRSSQKHLGLVLDSKLGFNQHINGKINRCNKIIRIEN